MKHEILLRNSGKGKLSLNSGLTFVVEAVDSVNRGTLMISAQDEEILGIFYFIG